MHILMQLIYFGPEDGTSNIARTHSVQQLENRIHIFLCGECLTEGRQIISTLQLGIWCDYCSDRLLVALYECHAQLNMPKTSKLVRKFCALL
jgi:DNA-directed RNA polymerase subunit RPC12/RpoP